MPFHHKQLLHFLFLQLLKIPSKQKIISNRIHYLVKRLCIVFNISDDDDNNQPTTTSSSATIVNLATDIESIPPRRTARTTSNIIQLIVFVLNVQ